MLKAGSARAARPGRGGRLVPWRSPTAAFFLPILERLRRQDDTELPRQSNYRGWISAPLDGDPSHTAIRPLAWVTGARLRRLGMNPAATI
jgi:hypothetical protein